MFPNAGEGVYSLSDRERSSQPLARESDTALTILYIPFDKSSTNLHNAWAQSSSPILVSFGFHMLSSQSTNRTF